MDIVSIIGNIANSLLGKFFPDKTEKDRQAFLLALQAELTKADLQKAQISVNQAEAANPNRTWITWRELLGYLLVVALSYQWFCLPIISLLAALSGHPLDMSKIFTIDILDVLYLMGGMLGLDISPVIANRVRNYKK